MWAIYKISKSTAPTTKHSTVSYEVIEPKNGPLNQSNIYCFYSFLEESVQLILFSAINIVLRIQLLIVLTQECILWISLNTYTHTTQGVWAVEENNTLARFDQSDQNKEKSNNNRPYSFRPSQNRLIRFQFSSLPFVQFLIGFAYIHICTCNTNTIYKARPIDFTAKQTLISWCRLATIPCRLPGLVGRGAQTTTTITSTTGDGVSNFGSDSSSYYTIYEYIARLLLFIFFTFNRCLSIACIYSYIYDRNQRLQMAPK